MLVFSFSSFSSFSFLSFLSLSNELAKISKPYMPGMYLYATTVNSDLGKKAINGMEPFYEA